MAKRTSSATGAASKGKRPATPRVASRKTSTKKLGEALGAEMQKATEHPGMAPQASTPLDMAREMIDVTHDMIAQRAYEIWQKEGGSQTENWLKAERELREQNIAAT